MKHILFLLAIILFQQSYAQTLKAKVVDENNEPIVGVTVYFDGTTRGVITNLDGIFEIESPENLSAPTLVINFLGYEAIYVKNLKNLKEVYQLQPKVENLNAIDIYQSPFSREEMLEVFKTYFLGTGKPAKKCEILNLDDVILYYVLEDNSLYAKSANPIIIQNNYLDYKIRFNLQKFEVKFSSKSLDDDDLIESFYSGFSYFEDLNPKKSRVRNKIYFRSLNFFLKSLVEDNLLVTNFVVGYNGSLMNPEKIFEVEPLKKDLYEVSLEDRVYETIDGEYQPTKIILSYKYDMSNVLFLKPVIRVNSFGNNLDVNHIKLIGELSEHRIAKMLPNNYSPQ